MLQSYTNNKYYDFEENNNSEDFANSENFTYSEGLNQLNSYKDTENFTDAEDFANSEESIHLTNTRNNLNNLEPYDNLNSNYETYSTMDFENSNQNEKSHNEKSHNEKSIERYDSTKMSEYVKMLEKKIPSDRLKSKLIDQTKSINPIKPTKPTKPAKQPNPTSLESKKIKDLSIDMTPYIYKYKKNNKYKENNRCNNALIISSTYLKRRSCKTNMLSFCEYFMYVLLIGILFCIFRKK